MSTILTTALPHAAHLISDAPPESDEWFAARRSGITGTDVTKILGDSDYGNALSVYRDKVGLDEPGTAGEAAEWGTLLEEVVSQEWARRNDVMIHNVGVLANNDHPWKVASLDRLVTGCPTADLCAYENKTRSAFKAGSFREEIPDDVLAQTAWQRLVTGLPHVHVGVLIGGQELRQFTYDADVELEQYLVQQTEPVWQSVLAGEPPHVEADERGVLLNLLNAINGVRDGEVEIDRSDAQKWIDQYREGGVEQKAAEGKKKQAMTEMVRLLGRAEVAVIDEFPAWTYKTSQPSAQMPAPNLAALRAEDRDLYDRLEQAGYVITKPGTPRFSLK